MRMKRDIRKKFFIVIYLQSKDRKRFEKKIILRKKGQNCWFLGKCLHLQSEIKESVKMKTGIHPDNYRLVAVKDMSNGDTFITKSCADTKETITIDGAEYPLIKREITNTSHPFYTGKMKLVDTAGRIDKFKNRYAKFSK